MKRAVAALLVSFALAGGAEAVQPDEQLADPTLEAAAREISAGLRCLVCQNQSIDDSDAPLARDLRLLVRERLQAGDSPAEVRDYLVARYGDFILLKPPFDDRTMLLWLTPLAVLTIGGAVAILHARRRALTPSAAPLSADEEARLAGLLGSGEGDRITQN
jgi:cytochrome c-type biogenesis protein CcmH